MPIGGQARSIHVQQVINWLRGLPSFSEAVNFTGLSSGSAHALTVANRHADGLAFLVKNSDRTVDLLDVRNSGVVIRPHAADQTVFRVRNYANDADLFAVTTTGLSLGGSISGARIGDYMDIVQQDPALSSDPSANRLRFYANIGSNFLKYRTSTGDVSTLVDAESAQTLINKTLTSPSLATPTFPSHSVFTHIANPGTSPSAGSAFIYTSADALRIKNSAGVVKNFATLEGTEELFNKTLTSATISTGTVFSGPVVSNFLGFSHTSNPGGAPSTIRLWADASGNVFLTPPSGVPSTVLTSTNTSITSSLGFARNLSLGGL